MEGWKYDTKKAHERTLSPLIGETTRKKQGQEHRIDAAVDIQHRQCTTRVFDVSLRSGHGLVPSSREMTAGGVAGKTVLGIRKNQI
jgi:hypothetical protein